MKPVFSRDSKTYKVVSYIADKGSAICESSNKSQKLYILAFIFILFAIIFSKIGISKDTTPFYTILILLSIPVTSDIVSVSKVIWNTMIGKLSISLAYFAATTFIFALSDIAINELVKSDAVSLAYTRNLLAVCFIPFAIWIASALAIGALVLSSQLLFMLSIMRKDLPNNKCFHWINSATDEHYPFLTAIVRLIAFTIVIGWIWGSGKSFSESYDKFMQDKVPSFIYNFEAKRFTQCNLKNNERGVKGEDGNYLIVSKQDEKILFRTEKCSNK